MASYAALAMMMMIAVAEDVDIENIGGNAVIMNMKIASIAALLTAAIMASIMASITIGAVAMIIVVVVVMALVMALEEAISYS